MCITIWLSLLLLSLLVLLLEVRLGAVLHLDLVLSEVDLLLALRPLGVLLIGNV